MTEAELQKAVEEICDRMDLLWFHDNDSRRNKPGFPDLVIVGRKVLFVELKSDDGHIKPAQLEWCVKLQEADAMYRLWRPRDFYSGRIQNELFWWSTK